MARKTRTAEDRLFDLVRDNFKVVNDRLETLSSDLAYNTKKTDKGFDQINGRLKKVETKVFPESPVEPTSKINSTPLWKDVTFIKWIVGIIAAIVAGWLGIDLSGVLK